MSALQTITKITEALLSEPSLSKRISACVCVGGGGGGLCVCVDITAELLFDQNSDLSVCVCVIRCNLLSRAVIYGVQLDERVCCVCAADWQKSHGQ